MRYEAQGAMGVVSAKTFANLLAQLQLVCELGTVDRAQGGKLNRRRRKARAPLEQRLLRCTGCHALVYTDDVITHVKEVHLVTDMDPQTIMSYFVDVQSVDEEEEDMDLLENFAFTYFSDVAEHNVLVSKKDGFVVCESLDPRVEVKAKNMEAALLLLAQEIEASVGTSADVDSSI